MTNRHSSTISLPTIGQHTRQPCSVEWLKVPDGAKLGYRVWQGVQTAPVVIYLHGIEGHSQWFENTADVLNESGITVYAPDRRGSGMNGNARGHLEDYNTLLADLESQIKHVRRQHRGQKVILIANCWSAKIAALFAQSNYQSTDKSIIAPLAGLVLTGPAIYTRADFSLLTKVNMAFGRLLGGKYLLNYWPIPITTAMLTDDPEFTQFINDDPLRITKATTSFFIQTFLATRKAQQAAKLIKIPVLILLGENDQIIDANKLEGWYEQLASTDKEIHAFPGASHSLDFDKAWFKEYTHNLVSWILSRGQFGIS